MWFGLQDSLSRSCRHAHQFREFDIFPGADKSNKTEQREHAERECGVTPCSPEGLRKIAGEKVYDAPSALSISAIDSTMSADYQVVEIIHEAWISRLCPRYRQI